MKRLSILFLLGGLLLCGCPKSPSGTGGGTGGGDGGGDAPGATAVDLSKAGTIKGKVAFDGTPPKLKNLTISGDDYCKTVHAEPLKEDHTIVKNGAMVNVYVYISEGLGNWKYDAPKGAVELDQRGCMYDPHVLGLQKGQTLKIVNSDKTNHNVHATPKKNAEFNKGQQAGDAALDVSFKTAELEIPVSCDIHSWMRCVVHVSAHPYFAVTGDDGSFSLPKIPAGKYKLTAWHEKLGKQTVDVEVKANAEAEASFTFKK